MRKIKYYAVTLILAAGLVSCGDDYDDSELKKGLNDLTTRVEKLENWCDTANGQISALQGLVSALESKDYVTGVTPVTEGTKEVGYTITFANSKPITILNGKDGTNGVDGANGITPIIGVKQDADGYYYWTVKAGDADTIWMTDTEGNKIRTTGDKGADGEDGTPGTPGASGSNGHSPVLSVADEGGKLYWKVDGEWLLSGGAKVPATGEKGETGATGPAGSSDSNVISAVDATTDPDNVTFTLAGGEKITLPKTNAVSIGFEDYGTYLCSPLRNTIEVKFASSFKKEQYQSITATVTNENGSGTAIQTRAAAGMGTWKVNVSKPQFNAGDGAVINGSCTVTVAAPEHTKLSDLAILKVTVVDAKGKEVTISRALRYFDGEIAENEIAGGFNFTTPAPKLAIVGSINADDLTYIKQNLTNLEVLDLSMTDLTAMPGWGLGFHPNDGYQPNTKLREVMLPDNLSSIGQYAFGNCRALTYINIEKATIITQNAFSECRSLREIVLNENLATIGNSAFYNCISLSSIDIPSSVKTLGRWIFENCNNLKTVTLHEGLENLSESTFYGCGIASIYIPSTVTTIPDWAFQECKELERVTWHNGITEIGMGAFLRCRSLKSISIPTGVTVIKNNTFDECAALRSVYFHDNITEMQEGAFRYCRSLVLEKTYEYQPYNLPTNLVTLGNEAFGNCTSIVSVSMHENVKVLPPNAFNGCTSLNDLRMPGIETIGEWAVGMCSSLVGITLPATLQSIDHLAFHGCTKLTQVYCHAATAPGIQSDTFGNDGLASQRYLYIPQTVSTSVYSSWLPYFGKGIQANQ